MINDSVKDKMDKSLIDAQIKLADELGITLEEFQKEFKKLCDKFAKNMTDELFDDVIKHPEEWFIDKKDIQ